MKERARNIAVGLTVIAALVLMAAMIVIFAGVPQMFQAGYEIRILFDGTHDAHEGDPVHLRGLRVGKITSIYFTRGDPAVGVTFTARIDPGVNLPGNTKAYLFTRGFVGGAYMELKPEGPPATDPATGLPMEFLPKDGSVVLTGRHYGAELMPEDLKEQLKSALQGIQELTSVAKEFGSLARNINELFAPPPETPPPGEVPAPAETQPAAYRGLRDTMARLNEALAGVTAVLGSRENQENIRKSLADLSEAAGKSSQAMEALRDFATEAGSTVKGLAGPTTQAAQRFDELARKLIVTAEAMSAAMVTINQAAAKVESGEGTAGRLINDPKLYNNLVDATRQMTELLKEMRVLVEKWKEEGLSLKLKS